MRKILLLLTITLLSSCTVVPDPTASGVTLPSGDTTIIGNWSSTASRGGIAYRNTLTLTSKYWYQRWMTDSTSGQHVYLVEQGTWDPLAIDDTAKITLTPNFREINSSPVSSPLAYTVKWTWTADSLRLILPRWNQRDSTDTLYWHRF